MRNVGRGSRDEGTATLSRSRYSRCGPIVVRLVAQQLSGPQASTDDYAVATSVQTGNCPSLLRLDRCGCLTGGGFSLRGHRERGLGTDVRDARMPTARCRPDDARQSQAALSVGPDLAHAATKPQGPTLLREERVPIRQDER